MCAQKLFSYGTSCVLKVIVLYCDNNWYCLPLSTAFRLVLQLYAHDIVFVVCIYQLFNCVMWSPPTYYHRSRLDMFLTPLGK